jgi:hypothetical protein
MTVISISSNLSGVPGLSRHNQLPWQMLKVHRGSGGK